MNPIERMDIAEIEYTYWGDETDTFSDWSLMNKHATFSHKDACEFIFWIGDPSDNECKTNRLEELKQLEFSSHFLIACYEAQKLGYRYLCFIA